ncbi:MAG: hypothetical protein P5702_02815 [Limnospira sp. PMC 1291.21]|nr:MULTISPECIES: hypothetical protein [unclassified Limnospira]MDT9179601.1 hypothetical protein [Limnospira sp. PMC 1238.20]MDT9194864.1 hypothetical protein [Limnospira sp. PMC 1245.20]MDT9202018.1 hypothetical protein [Limnospira sp. PMC 1243.20]MDT9210311.1 hypothetical protein [Limnospira sp. PMC 1252.20]MDT9212435.1 hypothetical protein [Limnospira sp. PMC 1256.20]
MENIDWETAIAAGLAGLIFLGAMLMMFTNFWTTALRKKDD